MSNSIKGFLKDNILVILIFIFSTSFFICQKFFGGAHWDFALYMSNAKNLFSNGLFFEWWVPPLTPFLLGAFSIFGWFLAEYAYITAVSLLFLFSCIKFSETFKINRGFFYAAMTNAYVLYYGLRNGTELLSLSLTILFFAYVFRKNGEKKSSFFLSLAVLARYSNMFLLLFILLNRNIKKIILSVTVFLLVLSPWLLYNYLKTGSPLTSMADYYVLVSLQRLYYSDPFLQGVSLAITAFFVAGMLIFRKKVKSLGLKEISMIILTFISIATFLNLPFRDVRYLFTLTLPLAYFFTKHFQKFKRLIFIILVFNIITTAYIMPEFMSSEDAIFKNIGPLDNCTVMSNVWVYLNYHDIPSEPYPLEEFVGESIDEGYRIVLFKWVKEPVYGGNETFLSQFPMIAKNSNYVILGNSSLCKGYYEINTTFKERKGDFLMRVHNRTIEEELGCYKNELSKALCYMLGI